MFTSAWHLKRIYPQIKQQKLQRWMQEADLRIWVTSPAGAGSEGTFPQRGESGCGRPSERLDQGGRQGVSAPPSAAAAGVRARQGLGTTAGAPATG